MKPTLMITGASGFLGWNLCRLATVDWTVVGVVHDHPIGIPDVRTTSCDIGDPPSLRRLFADVRPDAVIHAAALSDPNRCQTEPELSRRINVDASVTLARRCADAGIPCVFTSTDLVFDGRNPPYSEDDPINPISTYGEHKAWAEREMVVQWPSTVICRMPLMFGNPGPVARSSLQPIVQALREGRELRMFADEFRTPTSGKSAAQGLMVALAQAHGVFHLGGRESVSRFEFAVRVAHFLGSATPIIPVEQSSVPMPAPRPRDVSLDSTKAFDLGYSPLSLDEEISIALRELGHL